MAAPYTRGDSLGIYITTSDAGLPNYGGARGALTDSGLRFIVNTPIPQIVILAVGADNGEGDGVLAAASETSLTWTPPGSATGTAVTIAPNQTKLIEGTDADKWIRVYWDGDYSTADLGGSATISLVQQADSQDRTLNSNEYSATMLTNHSALGADITSIKAWIGTVGTQRVTGSAQLGGTGSGTITTATANGFADWPSTGWARITQSGGTLREIVYYTSRTATSLTVPSGGRALLGTSASAGAGTDLIDAVPGVRIGFETATSDNTIQEIPDATTAPTGITWSSAITSATGLTHSTLTSNQNLGLWIRVEIPAVAVAHMHHIGKINIEYTTGGTTYTNAFISKYNYRDTSLERWELYAGVDADPTFTSAATTSTSLPFTYALSAPVSGTREHRITVRKRNAFNLLSKNTLYHSTFVNSSGANVGSDLTSPINVVSSQVGDGKIHFRAEYCPALDADPADKWIVYATTNGVDPDPSVDTALEVADIDTPDLLTGKSYLSYTSPSLPWNLDLRALFRVKRSSDSEESANLEATQVTVDTGAPPLRNMLPTGGESYGMDQSVNIDTTAHSVSPSVQSIALIGQTIFKVVSTVVFRATAGDNEGGKVFINDALSFVNAAITGTGSGDVEAASSTLVYLCVGGERRAKIDLSAGTISAAQINQNGTIDDNPKTGPIDTDNSKLYLSVYNPARETWQPFLQLDDSGVLTFGFPVIQETA